MDYKTLIRDVPDFPKKGILFRDLTTLWKDGRAFRESLEELAARFRGERIDKVVGVEARGFVVASALAMLLGAGFVPVRKKGKLPAETIDVTYELEYGTDTLFMHKDAVAPGERVLVADDLIATGGTCGAAAELVRRLGGHVVGFAFLVELEFLKGRGRLEGMGRVEALVVY